MSSASTATKEPKTAAKTASLVELALTVRNGLVIDVVMCVVVTGAVVAREVISCSVVNTVAGVVVVGFFGGVVNSWQML